MGLAQKKTLTITNWDFEKEKEKKHFLGKHAICGRNFRVKIGSTLSDELPVISIVPQGLEWKGFIIRGSAFI